MATTDQIRAALASLVADPDGADPAAAVVTAERALRDVRRTAAWAEVGGDRRLASAVAGARDEDLRARARDVEEALASYRAVAGRPADDPRNDPPADHFRPGRTTLLGADGVRRDR